MKFGGKPEDLIPSEGGNQPTLPYIGRARLIDVNRENPSKKEGKQAYDVVQFHFEILDGEEKGTVYRHVEFEPSDDNQAENTWKRCSHILAQFIPGDKEEARVKAASAFQAESWQEFCGKVDALFNQNLKKERYSAKDDLVIKLLGQIQSQGKNKGKPKFGFPGYIGFVGDKRSEKPLSWSMREAQDNAEYLNFRNAKPDSMNNRDSGGGSSATAPAGTKGAEEPMDFFSE